MKHPAKYSESLLDVIGAHIPKAELVLDPFGGTGKLREVCPRAICMDIEPEWAKLSGLRADALRLPFANESVACIATSPTYGNRMADTFTDHTHRITYTNYIGHPLHENNSGKLQWGNDYKIFHGFAWIEAWRVLAWNGVLIINTKNHIRQGKEINVSGFHSETCRELDFKLVASINVRTPGNRFGQNRDKRVDYEQVMVFQK